MAFCRSAFVRSDVTVTAHFFSFTKPHRDGDNRHRNGDGDGSESVVTQKDITTKVKCNQHKRAPFKHLPTVAVAMLPSQRERRGIGGCKQKQMCCDCDIRTTKSTYNQHQRAHFEHSYTPTLDLWVLDLNFGPWSMVPNKNIAAMEIALAIYMAAGGPPTTSVYKRTLHTQQHYQ